MWPITHLDTARETGLLVHLIRGRQAGPYESGVKPPHSQITLEIFRNIEDLCPNFRPRMYPWREAKIHRLNIAASLYRQMGAIWVLISCGPVWAIL
jgi:hypothetical protein